MQPLSLLALGTLTLLVLAAGASSAAAQEPGLPKVALIGDSIRLGYAPLVAERLQGKALVISPAENGGDSSNVLKHLEEWVEREKPALVHLNCGLHDLKLDQKSKQYQVPLAQYEANLREIAARLRGKTRLIFALTTPIHDARHAARKAPFDRFEADVARYNETARRVMLELGIPVHDLHWRVTSSDPDRLQLPDGTHYTPEGYRVLAEAVTDCAQRHLAVLQAKPFPEPPSGPDAEAAYQKAEAERDAQVPGLFRNLKLGRFEPPVDAAAWKQRRPEVLAKVQESLGDLPPRPMPPRARVVSREYRPGYMLERVALDNGADGEVTALVLTPSARNDRAPAILWLHSSTPDKNQILVPNTFWGEEPLGEALVRQGYVVMAPDAYWHGDRAGTGPSGNAERQRDEQESLHKLNLWLGRTLWGMFVRDDQVALDYLCTRPEVDPARIGATGMSMGSTRAWWLAAVDSRVAAAVGIACLTRYQNLIAHGQLRAHGVYYFTYGLLKHFDTEAVVSLIAPRPFLALTGELDSGSPADGIREIERQAGQTYRAVGAPDRFRSILYPQVGHTVTPEMRKQMLAWFQHWLAPER